MKHLESLFDRALDAVVGMDEAGAVVAWNRSAEDMFGWSRAEAMGASMGELIVPPQHREAHARGLDRYNRTGDGPALEQKIRITALRRSGPEFPVELSIFSMPYEDGSQLFYAFIRSMAAEDEARRAHEARAREGEALLAIAQKLLDDVSHDEFTLFCLNTVCTVAGMEAGHLMTVRGRDERARLHPTDIWHLGSPQLQAVKEVTRNLRFAPGEGLPGRAWLSGQIQSLSDLTSSGEFARREVFEQVGLTRAVALPIWHRGQVQVVLELFGTSKARLDAEILRMLQTVGSQIGVAIRRKENAENRETLRRETTHRVGNSLSVLASIYRSCSRTARTKDELDKTFLGRLDAVGRANRMAVEEASGGVVLSALIEDATGLLPDRDRISIEVPEIVVDQGNVMSLALVLHELATNALKHGGFCEDCHLAIQAHVNQTDDLFELRWSELRRTPLSAPQIDCARIGYGTRLMQLMIEGRLGGRLSARPIWPASM